MQSHILANASSKTMPKGVQTIHRLSRRPPKQGPRPATNPRRHAVLTLSTPFSIISPLFWPPHSQTPSPGVTIAHHPTVGQFISPTVCQLRGVCCICEPHQVPAECVLPMASVIIVAQACCCMFIPSSRSSCHRSRKASPAHNARNLCVGVALA